MQQISSGKVESKARINRINNTTMRANPGTWRIILVVFALVCITGCRQQEPAAATPTTLAVAPATPTQATLPVTPTLAPATSTPVAASTATPAPTATIQPGYFENPVITTDFPDPSVIEVGGSFYAYATNGNGHNIQIARSTDLVHWTLLPDAMPSLASWTMPDLTWAPSVITITNRYVMYYTARAATGNRQCISVATSDKPEGPFSDTNDHPLICQLDEGGSIDPAPLRDGDKLYLYWKNDGNCCGITTRIYVQALAPDGLSVTGTPTELVSNDQRWEGQVVEAPTMVKHGTSYYLFFSGNNYAVGYATCQTATGPCKDASDNPILHSVVDPKPPVIGPGGETIVNVCNQTWIVYHAWGIGPAGLEDKRFMWIDRLTWDNGDPHVQGPTTTPQPDPQVACVKH